MSQINTPTFYGKVVLVYLKVLVSCMTLLNFSGASFEELTLEATVHPFSLYIFYGMMTLFLDGAGIRLFFSETGFLRYRSRGEWAARLLFSVGWQQGLTCLLAGVFLTVHAVLLGFPLKGTPRVMGLFLSLWVYLTVLNFLVVLIIMLTHTFHIGIIAGLAVNLCGLVLGHMKILRVEEWQHTAGLFLAAVLIAGGILWKSRTFQMYQNRRVRAYNGN